MAGREARKFKK